MFLLTSKFCPQGVVSPCPGALYMCKIMKKMYKIRLRKDFLKLVANDQSEKRFLLASKFCSLGLSAPDLQLFTFNDDPGLTLTIFYDRVKCVPDASVWVTS